LAIFIHKALTDRASQGIKIPYLSFIAFSATFTVGELDEFKQIFLPDRVFDTNDIIFNGFAAFLAIVSGAIIQWVRRKTGRIR